MYNASGTIAFNNATFGDPVPGVFKVGYWKVAGGDGAGRLQERPEKD